MVGRSDNNHSNRSYTIRLTKTGCIINRNSKCIKATPIKDKQYPRDQLNQHAEDPPDKILKQYEKLSLENVPYNPSSRRKEEICMNNKSDTQNSNTQEHMINNVLNNQEQTGNIKQTRTNGNIDKPDESINTWTHYGRYSRTLDRLPYH